MDPLSRDLDRLEQKIDRLKREYDLFLAGKRRGEPLTLKDEVERDILRLTRSAVSSTAVRFRMRTLAHRFQAIGTQMRNLVELRVARRRAKQPEGGEDADSVAVLLDRAAVENPDSVAAQIEGLGRAIAEATGGAVSPPLAVIAKRLFDEARRYVERPDVLGVKFSVVRNEAGAKIKGEVLRRPPPSDNEEPNAVSHGGDVP